MRRLWETHLGERFRIARPVETSMNEKLVTRGSVLVVKKIYDAKPPVRVCEAERGIPDGIITLLPGIPIIGVNEPTPSDEHIEKFLDLHPVNRGRRAPKRLYPVSYILRWDGSEPPDSRVAQDLLRTWIERGGTPIDWDLALDMFAHIGKGDWYSAKKRSVLAELAMAGYVQMVYADQTKESRAAAHNAQDPS